MRNLRVGILTAVLFLAPAPGRADVLEFGFKTVPAGLTVGMDVEVLSATDLYAFQFDVTFDPSILQLQDVLEGPFLRTAGTTFFPLPIIDNVGGTASVFNTLVGSISGASGGGKAVTFEFLALQPGFTHVVLGVTLLDSLGNDIELQGCNACFGGVTVTSTIPEVSSVWLLAAVVALCWIGLPRWRRVRSARC